MNERIKIVSDECVVLTRIAQTATWVLNVELRANDKGNLLIDSKYPLVAWDAQGFAALRDCINCLEATGSFAALSDESAVPYVGKRLRIINWDNEMLVTAIYDDQARDNPLSALGTVACWEQVADGRCRGSKLCVDITSLLPLTPAPPKVRPYTSVEAAAHLNRMLRSPWSPAGVMHELQSLGRFGVCTSTGETISYQSLTSWKWADDGTPCGVKEEA